MRLARFVWAAAFLAVAGVAVADEPAAGGRSLEDIMRTGVGDEKALDEAAALLDRYDGAAEDSVKRVLSRQVAVLVRRNLQVFTRAAQTEGPKRQTAVRALTLAVAPDTVELMIKLLDAPKLEVRVDAVKALGELRDARSTDALVTLLNDKTTRMRLAAAEALGRLADRRSLDSVLKRLVEEDDDATRVALAEGLGRMRALEAKKALERFAADKATSPKLKETCEKALKAINRKDPEFKIPKTLRQNPLPSIGEQMDGVGERLDYHWSGKRTQDKQEQIVKAMDLLIEMLEEQQQGGGGGGGGGGGQGGQQGGSSGGASGQGGGSPAADDSPNSSSAGGDTAHARRRIAGIKWGNLPPAVRGEVEQALRANLPERYRRLLESYTKALAEAEERRR